MRPEDQAIGYAANFTCVALTILVNCLKKEGALGTTQFEDELQATLSAEGADRAIFLKDLLKHLRRHQSGQPPSTVLLN